MKNYRLYDAEMFYKEGLIPSKDNAGYQEYLGEMHTKFPELNAMGIYGIRYNGRIAYVGKSTDICNRWIAHMWNVTSKNSKEYNRSMYIFLRHMLQLGNVQFEVLETTTDKEKLSYLEAYYINSLMPMLNKKVPKLKDRFYKIDKEHSVWDINPGSMENCVQIACDFDNNRMNKEKLIYLKAYYFNIYGGSEYKWDVRLRDTEKKLYRSDVMRVMPKITAKEYADILDDLTNNRTAKVACQDKTPDPRTGENNPMWGKHHSEETKAKMRAASSGGNNPSAKAVRCVETGTIYPTIKEAGLHNGIAPTGISQCCKGNQQTAGRYHWEYVEKK